MDEQKNPKTGPKAEATIYEVSDTHHTATYTDSVLETIPKNELIGTSIINADNSASASTSEVEMRNVERLREEEATVRSGIEWRSHELSELEQQVRELQEEEGHLKKQLGMLSGLEQHTVHLRKEEARLTRLCEERQKQIALEAELVEEKCREREMKVQHQLYEANNRESANRQENLRLQRLAGQLHMQKKALDHREFDLENFHNDRPGVLDEQRAELREREKRLHQQEADVNVKERELDQSQAISLKWMNKEQLLINQWMQELDLPPKRPSTYPSYPHPDTITLSRAHTYSASDLCSQPPTPSHPHTVPSSRTHKIAAFCSDVTQYSHHNATLLNGIQLTQSHILTDERPHGALAITGYPTVHDPPSNIVVTSQYPGSPRAKVEWSFAGESSDIAHFLVLVQVEGKMQADQEVPSGNRGTEVSGMLPLKTHLISVVAVYRDGVKMKQNTNFIHSDRSYPRVISITPEFDGSPKAAVSWSFAGPSMDLSHFQVIVKAKDKGVVFLNSASDDERNIAVENLHPLTKHEVTVVAVYTDEIEKKNSIDYIHTGHYYPEEVEITQDVAGSNEARVTWSFPEGISNLSYFISSVKRESNDVIIYCKRIAAVNRDDVVNGLEPMGRYTVAVAAVYKDGKERKRVVEYENTDYGSPEDIKIVGSSQTTIEWTFPANCRGLSQFRVILRKKDCEQVVDEIVVAAQERQAQIDGLKPSTKYSVTVAAEYSNGNLKQSSKEHMTCDCFKKDVSHLETYSLPVVKKYFHFADALELSFLQPIEVITLTSKGNIVTNDKEGITVHVPDDAVPVGKQLHIEVGSAMYGNLSFPKGMHPVSPILWICPQDEMDLLKPFKITLPHTVKYEEGVTELFFLKACHSKELPIDMSTRFNELEVFNFEEMTHHKGIEFNERNASIYTKLFCCVCIAENVRRPTKKRYLLHRTQPCYRNTREFAVDYCITFDMQTCVQTFHAFCKERQLDVRCDWPAFTFNSELQLLTDLPSTSRWIVDIRSEKTKIAEDEVDFWKYKKDIKKLNVFQEQRRYPPKITLEFIEGRAASTSKVGISFSGAVSSRPLKDSIRLHPRESYRIGWTQCSLRNFTESGKHTQEYKALLNNLIRISDSLSAVPKRTERLRLNFIQKKWIEIHADVDASQLVIVALQRVDEDSCTFYEFVNMLSDISGMDALATDLLDCKLQLK